MLEKSVLKAMGEADLVERCRKRDLGVVSIQERSRKLSISIVMDRFIRVSR